jgi:hypothetical protein
MVKERCWHCNKVRSDVELRANNDRMCEPCCRKNEEELAVMRRNSSRKNNTTTPKSGPAPAAATAASPSTQSDSPRAKRGVAADGAIPAAGILCAGLVSPAGVRDKDVVLRKSKSNQAHVKQHQCKCQELRCQVEQFMSTVEQQKEIIAKLSYQLKVRPSVSGHSGRQHSCDSRRTWVIQILSDDIRAAATQYGTGNAPCADLEAAGPVPAATLRPHGHEFCRSGEAVDSGSSAGNWQ